MIQEITDSTFVEEVFTSSKPSIVEFSANWCSLCEEFKYDFEILSNDYPNINFFKINIDEEYIFADKFKVSKLPTFVLFKNRMIVNMFFGIGTIHEFKLKIDKLL